MGPLFDLWIRANDIAIYIHTHEKIHLMGTLSDLWIRAKDIAIYTHERIHLMQNYFPLLPPPCIAFSFSLLTRPEYFMGSCWVRSGRVLLQHSLLSADKWLPSLRKADGVVLHDFFSTGIDFIAEHRLNYYGKGIQIPPSTVGSLNGGLFWADVFPDAGRHHGIFAGCPLLP